MTKKLKMVTSVVISMVMVLSMIINMPVVVSATNTADDIVAVAQGEVGSTNYSKYYGGHKDAWCADFVTWCAQQAGVSSITNSASCTAMYEGMKENGCQPVSTAQKGDLVFYYNQNRGSWMHVGIMVDETNAISGNYWSNNYSHVALHNCNAYYDMYYEKCQPFFVRPNYNDIPLAPVRWYDNLTPVDLGTDFCALIFNKSINKPLTVEQNCNVAIKSEKSGWCVDQVWKFERQSDGSYKIVSSANRECLDVDNASNESGTNVKTCMDNGNNAQRWLIYENNSNYILKSKCTDCVLDVSNNNSSDGTNIQMCTFTNSSAQIFDICKIDNRDFAVNLGDNFLAKIVNTKSKILLENDKNGNVHLQNGDIGINQLWQFKRQSDGSYKIYSEFDGNCIDLCWANHENGTNIQVCSDYPNDAQCWYLYEYAGAYSIQSKESGKCFDIENGNLNYGANLQSYMWNWTDSQIFSIDKVDSTFQYLSKNIGDGFYALIKNKTSGKPIENNNSNVILGGENFSKNQVWFFERKTDNSYKISSLFDNKVIDLTNYGNTDGTNIQMCVSTDTTAQRWYIVENNGGYSFIPKCSQNGAMDLNGNSSAKGSNIQFWTFNGTDAQIFSIEKISDLDTYLKHIRECDINFDGTIDIKDIILMQRYLLGMISLSEQQLEYADYNNDGKFSLADIVAVQRYIMSL